MSSCHDLESTEDSFYSAVRDETDHADAGGHMEEQQKSQRRSNNNSNDTPDTSFSDLIHSAARCSVLDQHDHRHDHSPPGSAVSSNGCDDEEDEEEAENTAYYDVDNDVAATRQHERMSLESLQTQTLPAMPDEQDRKRFVVRSFSKGCL
jgi:hypothetical protein